MNCNNAITIVKGNDTDFNGVNLITINLITEILDLSTFKATFKLGKITRNFDDISSGAITINFTAAETLTLPPFSYGTLNLIDTAGKLATIENVIPFKVIDVVDNNAIATEPYTLNFDVKQGGETILNVSVESAVTVEVGQTTTLPAGSDATVTNSGSFNHLVLDFGIPRGYDGSVLSVNGKTGDVVLTPSDIDAQAEITEENKLNSDLVDDTTAVHKFATAEELTQIETNKNDITALDNKYDSITGVLDDKIDSINGALSDSINALDSVVSANYNTLDGKIDSVNGALSDSITGLDTKYDSITGALSDSISAIDSTIGGYGDIVTHNVSEFATAAQGALADSAIQPNDNVSELANDAQYITIQPVNTETTNRENADLALQQQIDAIVASSDVFDVVGTYADLQNYDISTVPVNDIIKVLVDSTHNDAATYYRCVENNNVKFWSYIGSEGAYYTKGEADSTFVPQTRTVNSKALSSNITLTASDVGALPSSTTIGAGVLTIQKNSTDVGSFGANDTSNKTINLSIPTKLSDITVSAGANIQINGDTISATDTTYTAGTGIDITNGVISNTLTSAEWGNITGILSSQTDLQNALDAKQDELTVGSGISIVEAASTLPLEQTLPLSIVNNIVLIYSNLDTSKTLTVVIEVPYGANMAICGRIDNRYCIGVRNNSSGLLFYDTREIGTAEYNQTTISTSGSNAYYVKFVIYSDYTSDVYYSLDGTSYTQVLYSSRSDQKFENYGNLYLYEGGSATYTSILAAYGTDIATTPTISCDNTIARVSDLPTNYMTTDTAQDVSGRKTFLGEKAIYFKQSATTDKLGFTLYNPSNSELAALEWRPSTVNGNALLALNCPQAGSNYVGFRYWANINIVAPRPATNGTYFIPVNITNGNVTVTASSTGTVDISSLMPSLSGYQTTANLVTSVSSSSTDSQYPSAKLFYDTCGDIETLINAL